MTERVDIAALRAHAAKGWGTDALIPKSVIELLCAELQAARAVPADQEVDTRTGPDSGLNQSLRRAIEASEAGHDAFCMSILRGKDCDCGFERRKRATPADQEPASQEKFEWARKVYDVSESVPGELQRFWDCAVKSAGVKND